MSMAVAGRFPFRIRLTAALGDRGMRERIDKDVAAFVEAYALRYALRWTTGPEDDDDTVALAARYRLDPRNHSVGSEFEHLRQMVEGCPGLPGSYMSFMNACEFSDLDIPWIQFPSNRSGCIRSELAEEYSAFGPQRLVPFAFDIDGYGVFLFDCRSGVADPAVLFWNRGFAQPLVGPVFSSFSHLLRVLEKVLRHPDPMDIYVDGVPTTAQVAFLGGLRGVDPAGFGGPGWVGWWKEKILGVSGPDI